MTTGTTRFTEPEWSTIAGAPLLAAMAVIADERGGARATLAVVRAYRDARGANDTELLRELVTTPPAHAMQRPQDPEALRREASGALRAAIAILERAATVEERAEYRRFVLALAGAAARNREGDLLRRRRAQRIDAGREMLDSITAILRHPEA